MDIKNLNPEQKDSLKWWAFFIVAMGVLSAIVYYSTKEAYPDLLTLASGCLVLSIAAAAYNHSMADQPDTWVKVPAIIGMILIACLDIGNVWGHVGLARDLSASGSAEIERQQKQQWELDLEEKRVKLQKERNDSQAELNRAEAQASTAEARRLNALPVGERVNRQPRTKPTPAPAATPQTEALAVNRLALPTPTPSADDLEARRLAGMSKAEVRATWRWYFSTILLLTVAVSVVSCFATRGLKMLDSDKNGVPNYVERIFMENEALCQRMYPDHYATLIGQRAQQQARAQQYGSPLGNP